MNPDPNLELSESEFDELVAGCLPRQTTTPSPLSGKVHEVEIGKIDAWRLERNVRPAGAVRACIQSDRRGSNRYTPVRQRKCVRITVHAAGEIAKISRLWHGSGN